MIKQNFQWDEEAENYIENGGKVDFESVLADVKDSFAGFDEEEKKRVFADCEVDGIEEYAEKLYDSIEKVRGGNNVIKRYGEDFILTQDEMNNIASYMDDEKREALHAKMAPCEPAEFLKAYVDVDPEFSDLLESEFGIEI